LFGSGLYGPERLQKNREILVFWVEKKFAGAKQAAEKGLILEESPEKHTSGAKAPFIPLHLYRG
jgi:hypothetical protein